MDIKRLNHLGIVAVVIKELKLVEAIDKRLQKDENEQENITTGEAIAGYSFWELGNSKKHRKNGDTLINPCFANKVMIISIFKCYF